MYQNPPPPETPACRAVCQCVTSIDLNGLGQIVHRMEMDRKQTSIDLSGLASGIYYVRLLHNDQAYTLKMIRE